MDLRETMTREQWGKLYVAVLTLAKRITCSRAAAEELTQAAFDRLLTTRPWNPDGKTTLEKHMLGIVKSLLWAERISKRADYESRSATEEAAVSDAGRSAEKLSLDHAERERKEAGAAAQIGTLRETLAGHQLELRVLDLMEKEGLRKPAEPSARTGATVPEINAALSRIRRFVRTIVAADRGEDEEVA